MTKTSKLPFSRLTPSLCLGFLLSSPAELAAFSCRDSSYSELISVGSTVFTGKIIDIQIEAMPTLFGEYQYNQKSTFEVYNIYKGDSSIQTISVVSAYSPSTHGQQWGAPAVGSEWLVVAIDRNIATAVEVPEDSFPDVALKFDVCYASNPLLQVYFSLPVLPYLPEPVRSYTGGPFGDAQLSKHFAYVEGRGLLYTKFYPWVRDPSLGYCWQYDGSVPNGVEGQWTYAENFGNLWIDPAFLPWVYSSAEQGWRYYAAEGADGVWLWSPEAQEWGFHEFNNDWYAISPSVIPESELEKLH